MEALTYRLDEFEGPLDLLLSLIKKNKVNIEDIPIALICDQYMQYISAAESMDLDIASEFIVMASELMLIKSKMLLPRVDEEEEDPRKQLADALLRYQQAKAATLILAPRYARYSGRMVKETDEISVDRTFVADQSLEELCTAVRRLIAYGEAAEKARSKEPFTPIVGRAIVPVEAKIVGILDHLEQTGEASLGDLLNDSVSLPDLIAIFIGILELMKVGRILAWNENDGEDAVVGDSLSMRFCINQNYVPQEEAPDISEEPTDESEEV